MHGGWPWVAGTFDPSGALDAVARAPIAGLGGNGAWSDRRLAVAWHGVPGGDTDRLIVGAGAHHRLEDLAAGAPSVAAMPAAGVAGVVWDRRRQAGALVRDPVGIRLLYLAAASGRLHFATDLRILLALSGDRARVDHEALARWLCRAPLGRGRTLYQGVVAVPAGHRVLLSAAGWHAERYWRPRPRPGLAGLEAAAAAQILRQAVGDAVRSATAGRTPAVMLSGGLDSSVVQVLGAQAARRGGDPVPTPYSAVFPDHPDQDERPFLRSAARAAGVSACEVPIRAGGLTEGADRYIETTAAPPEYASGLAFAPVARAALDRGHDVLLDGEGGDELFGCEPVAIVDALLRADPARAWRLTREIPGMGDRVRLRALRAVGRTWILPPLVPGRVEQRLRGPRPGAAPPWLRVHPGAMPRREPWPRRAPLWRSRLAWLLTAYRDDSGAHHHLDGLARLYGIESAHPLMSPALIETVLGLPPALAFDRDHDRALLRRSMAGALPDDVRLREDKTTFDRLVLDSLTGPDHDAVAAMFAGPMRLGRLVDRRALAAMVARGPEAHPRGSGAWVLEVWRAQAAERWLRTLPAS